MVAFATVAPEGSVTLPFSELVACAAASEANSSTTMKTEAAQATGDRWRAPSLEDPWF
jgi:hypothetical protein